jgi:hypothetical protein
MGRDQGGRMRRRICRGGMVRRGVWECVWSSGVVFSGGSILVLWSRVGVGDGEAERQELGQFRRLRFGFGLALGMALAACPSETRREIDVRLCLLLLSTLQQLQHADFMLLRSLHKIDGSLVLLSHCHHVLEPYHPSHR